MQSDNAKTSSADQQARPSESIQDLSAITSDDADRVKGGFDPQPEPPRTLDPRLDPGQIAAKKFVKW